VFSKPKEQKENSKAVTSGDHRGERTTIFLLSRVSAEEAPKERGSEEDEKRRKGGAAQKTERRQVRQPDGTILPLEKKTAGERRHKIQVLPWMNGWHCSL
jgi:hypothetical protein